MDQPNRIASTGARREFTSGRSPWSGPGFGEFVGIVALMMAVTAMSIDNLLPAFPAIQA